MAERLTSIWFDSTSWMEWCLSRSVFCLWTISKIFELRCVTIEVFIKANATFETFVATLTGKSHYNFPNIPGLMLVKRRKSLVLSINFRGIGQQIGVDFAAFVRPVTKNAPRVQCHFLEQTGLATDFAVPIDKAESDIAPLDIRLKALWCQWTAAPQRRWAYSHLWNNRALSVGQSYRFNYCSSERAIRSRRCQAPPRCKVESGILL